MSTKQRNNRQKIGSRARSANDPLVAARASAIRARLRSNARLLRRGAALSRPAAALARRLLALGAQQRLSLKRMDDLEQNDRDVLLGMVGAALLTALDCGMSRAQFAAWLRRQATNVSDGFYPTTH